MGSKWATATPGSATEPWSTLPVYIHSVTRTLRTLLIWLMMLAIPTQGFAAAAMLYCGPASDGGRMPGAPDAQISATSGHATIGHAHRMGDTHAGHAHDHAMAESAGPHLAVTDQTGSDAEGFLAEAACSVCAACCSGAALVASVLVLSAHSESFAPMRPLSVLALDFFTDGPRRPPRSLA